MSSRNGKEPTRVERTMQALSRLRNREPNWDERPRVTPKPHLYVNNMKVPYTEFTLVPEINGGILVYSHGIQMITYKECRHSLGVDASGTFVIRVEADEAKRDSYVGRPVAGA